MPSTDRAIIAIDLGTSGPKVALYTTQGQCLGYEFEETPFYLSPGGGAEQKPGEWWQAIKLATRRLLHRGLVPKESIRALCCTTQWSGTVAVDRNGKPLRHAIIWMDSRGAKYIQQVTGGVVEVAGFGLAKLVTWLRLTGGIPGNAGKDPIAHILFLKHEEPDIYEETYKFLEPKDYLNLRLTGRCAASYDSITLHWVTDTRHLERVDYHPSLLKLAQIDREKLPDLVPPNTILGNLSATAAAELGLTTSVQVISGTPDVQSAAIGSGAVRDLEGHLYIGTSSWISAHVPFKKTDVLHNIASLPSAIPDRYLVANEQETAGACLNFLRDNILYHQDELLQEEQLPNIYRIFDRITARAPAGSGGLIFTPWLYGERTPVDDHQIRAGFHNLSLSTTREHIIRSVFEGVAFNARWLLGYVEKFIGKPFEALNIIGGGANSDIWCQIFADVFNRPIRQVKDPILANARGAAFLAAVALGEMRFEDIPAHTEIQHTYQPNAENRQVYDKLFTQFVKLYQRNRPIYAHLNA